MLLLNNLEYVIGMKKRNRENPEKYPNIKYHNCPPGACRAGSDDSMSAFGSIPDGVVNFHLKIFNLGARRGGDVHFLIARLYITDLDRIPVHMLRRHVIVLIAIRPSDGDVKPGDPLRAGTGIYLLPSFFSSYSSSSASSSSHATQTATHTVTLTSTSYSTL